MKYTGIEKFWSMPSVNSLTNVLIDHFYHGEPYKWFGFEIVPLLDQNDEHVADWLRFYDSGFRISNKYSADDMIVHVELQIYRYKGG